MAAHFKSTISAILESTVMLPSGEWNSYDY